jgi:CheY-specific phosphatase CheX
MSGGLDAAVVDEFMAAVVHCLRATVGVEAAVAALGVPGTTETRALSVAIDFEGDVRGPVVWTFPAAISLELVKRLLADPSPSPDSEADGAQELANILTGRASEVLEARGFRYRFGTPRVTVGAPPAGPSVRMNTEHGPIDIVMSMEPKP